MRIEFDRYTLNDEGKAKLVTVGEQFSALYSALEQLVPKGRELSLVLTKFARGKDAGFSWRLCAAKQSSCAGGAVTSCRVSFCRDAALFGWRLCAVHHMLWMGSPEARRAEHASSAVVWWAALVDWVTRHELEMANGYGPNAKPTPTPTEKSAQLNGDSSKHARP